MKTISLTVPMDHDALTRASDMLHGMALDVKNDVAAVSFEEFENQMMAKIAESFNIPIEKLKTVFDDNADGALGIPSTNAAPAPDVAEQEASVQTASVTTISGVELDKEGLPWDVRINSSSKKQTVKEGTWKLKRGVDPALVETVLAELKAAMAIPAATIETSAPSAPAPAPTTQPAAPAPAPIAEPVKYLVEGVPYTADELKGFNSGWNDENIEELPVAEQEPAPTITTTPMTFPELMAKITSATAANTVTQKQVLAACNKNGLASLPLLSACPDLIPAIDVELFG